MSFQSPRDQANQYLEKHNIHRLFSLLGAKLAVAQPEDINEFLLKELQSIQSEREKGADGERYSLFTPTDVDAIFTAFDLTNKGYITHDQYLTALAAVGISKPHFPSATTDKIDRKLFMSMVTAELSQDAF